MKSLLLIFTLSLSACDPGDAGCDCQTERASRQAAEIRADKAERMLKQLQDEVLSDRELPVKPNQ